MANEISVSLVFNVVLDEFSDTFKATDSITLDSIGRGGYVQSIGTSEEVVNFGDIVVNGICILKNLDDTNYIEYGPNSGGSMVAWGKLLPGEFAYARIKPGVVMRAQANTAPILLETRLYEGT